MGIAGIQSATAGVASGNPAEDPDSFRKGPPVTRKASAPS